MEKSSEIAGKTFELALLVDYQEGAVVSREIIKQDGGTVTLFAFDEGQGLSEHTAPFDAFVYVADGRAEIRIADNTSIAQTGEMIILPADTPHALKALTKFKMLLVMIKRA
jgi:quercetin dioxygenase-like cupin family protein